MRRMILGILSVPVRQSMASRDIYRENTYGVLPKILRENAVPKISHWQSNIHDGLGFTNQHGLL